MKHLLTRTAVVTLCAAAGLLGLAVLPARGATTTTTFALSAGGLSVTAPATSALGTTSAGSALTAQLGGVTVTDARGALAATWTATASTTDFTTGGATTQETVTAPNVAYASGAATATTGIGVFTPGQATVGLAQALSAPRTAFTLTAGVGNNTASWNPSLVVTTGPSNVSGTYSGTVTHSVA